MANWYVYTGNGDPTLSANYGLLSIKPTCTTGEEICAICLNSNTVVPNDFF